MRIRTDDMRMDEGWAVSFTAVARSTLECGIAGHGIGTVDFFEMEVGESGNQARNASTRGLDLHRHRNCVPIVFHAENYRQLSQCSGIHGLPEFTFAGSAIAERNISDFIALEADVLELTVVCEIGGWNLRGLGMPCQVASGLGAAHGLENRGTCRRRLRHNVKVGIAAVGGHLASARTGVVGLPNPLQKHVVRLDPERQTQRAIPIIRVEPVIPPFHCQASGYANALMPCPGHLEIDLLLALEQDFPVVNPPGGVDDAVGLDELLARKSFI